MTQIKVIKNAENPESTEVLAQSIVKIGEAMEHLKSSGMNEYGIRVLLQHETKLPMRDIKLILDSMRKLKAWYCR